MLLQETHTLEKCFTIYLEKEIIDIKKKHYNLIVSDMDMPQKTGLELHNEAVSLYPDLGERILFFTGFLSNDYAAFLKDNKLHYLTKPASMHELRKKCMIILRG